MVPQMEAVVDSGAQSHYLPREAAGDPRSWGKLNLRTVVKSASNTDMPVLGTAKIHSEGLVPLEAKVLDSLVDPLISVPRLCSQGYTVTFDKHRVKVIDTESRVVSEGFREPGEGGLYKLPMQVSQKESLEGDELADMVIDEKAMHMPNLATYYGGINFKDKADRVAFFHAALGYPTVACLVAAMKSHLKLPGISAEDVLRNPPKTEATAKGHLRQHLMGVRSTKRADKHRQRAGPGEQVSEGIHQEGPSIPQHAGDSEGGHQQVSEVVISEGGHQESQEVPQKPTLSRNDIPGLETEEYPARVELVMHSFVIGKLSADSSGRMPVQSVMNDESVHFTYIEEPNIILMTPIKSKAEVNDVLMNNYEKAIQLGHKIGIITTDNEISKAAETYFAKLKVHTRRVEPYNHRGNACERHIQTAKAHIIATLAGRDSECSLANWDKAVKMAELTMSLLRPGRVPGQSSYHSFYGKEYDFAANPFAPWGVKVQAFVPRSLRKTWGYRSKSCFYMGPVNYRQHQLREDGGKTPFVRQQVVFMSPDLVYPKYTTTDAIIAGIKDLTDALTAKGSPPDVTLAQALQAYAEAFPSEDDEYPLMEASVLERDGMVTWVASPVDFPEEAASNFPEVTHYEVPNATSAAEAAKPVEAPAVQIEAQPAGESTTTPSVLAEGPTTVPTEHVPTGKYATRGAKRHGVIADPLAEEKEQDNDDKILVLTEIDHKTLTMRKAMLTPDAADWARANAAELDRFLAIDGVKLVPHDELPYGIRPRPVVQVLEHKEGKARRVRAAVNGAPRKHEVREEQYSSYASDHLGKKIFFAALATRSKKSGARLATLDIESFYLHERNKLPRTEYMYYFVTYLPED